MEVVHTQRLAHRRYKIPKNTSYSIPRLKKITFLITDNSSIFFYLLGPLPGYPGTLFICLYYLYLMESMVFRSQLCVYKHYYLVYNRVSRVPWCHHARSFKNHKTNIHRRPRRLFLLPLFYLPPFYEHCRELVVPTRLDQR